MFSTSAAEALPVRTPANSFMTTCSVLLILSSASSKKSSNAISEMEASKSRFECIEGKPQENGKARIVYLEGRHRLFFRILVGEATSKSTSNNKSRAATISCPAVWLKLAVTGWEDSVVRTQS